MREETRISFPVVTARSRRLTARSRAAAALLVGALAIASVWACRSLRPATPGVRQAESGDIRITVRDRDADVTQILKSVAAQADAMLALSPAIHGKMSIEAKDARLDGLMNDLCTAFSCTWKLAGTPRSLIVLPAAAPAVTDSSLASASPPGQ